MNTFTTEQLANSLQQLSDSLGPILVDNWDHNISVECFSKEDISAMLNEPLHLIQPARPVEVLDPFLDCPKPCNGCTEITCNNYLPF